MPKKDGTNEILAARRRSAVPQSIAVKSDIYADNALGAEIVDAEGARYIDFAAGIGVLNVGHRHPKVIAAIQSQLDAYLHTCFHAVPYESYIELAERLNALVSDAGEYKTALFNSGAEAIENAIKVARVCTGRQQVIAFDDSFHGRTLMALTMTGKEAPLKTGLGPMVPGVFRAPFSSLNAVKKLLATEVTELAAIIVEPVQGEGGFNIAGADFMQGLRDLCDQNSALLIVDEIQSGMGRTGKYFAFQHSGIAPDLIAAAKSLGGGLPISALIGKAELMDAPSPGALGSTYGGNPLSCAAALAVLDIIESEDLLARAELLGSKIETQLSATVGALGNHISELRRLGAMVAIEFNDPQAVKQIVELAREQGLLLLTAGRQSQVIRLLPPLVIEWSVLDEALAILTNSIKQTLS